MSKEVTSSIRINNKETDLEKRIRVNDEFWQECGVNSLFKQIESRANGFNDDSEKDLTLLSGIEGNEDHLRLNLTVGIYNMGIDNNQAIWSSVTLYRLDFENVKYTVSEYNETKPSINYNMYDESQRREMIDKTKNVFDKIFDLVK